MSIWKSFEHNKQILNENKNVDILVIGGGITGLMSAYYLKDKSVCVVEARTIGNGVTKNTTAKIDYLQGGVYTKIKSFRGSENAKLYLDSQLKAIKEYKRIIHEENIDCDFTQVSSYVFANKSSEVKRLKKEVKFLEEASINVKNDKLPVDVKSYFSYNVNDCYQFNPLKFLKGMYDILIKSRISIYEDTKVFDLKKVNDFYVCNCGEFSIKAKYVIFATGYPYFLFPLLLPLKSFVEKSYICVRKVNDYKNISCISSSYPIYSTRFYKDSDNIYQICLGGSHNTAFKQDDNNNFNMVKNTFHLSDQEIIYKYSNTDIITSDYLPLIGEIKENMFIGVGFNTWGMTNSILAGKIISDLIKFGVNEYMFLFNPKRFNISNIVKFPYILFSQIKSYVSSKICKSKSWYSENVVGDDIGYFIDENGIKHEVKNKCPHMGCGLIFNEEEKTWDCPCHSSRFDIDGNVIKGPSNRNIKL